MDSGARIDVRIVGTPRVRQVLRAGVDIFAQQPIRNMRYLNRPENRANRKFSEMLY